MAPCLRKIAERTGTSLSTVSRVLNDRPYVRPEIRKKVLDAAHQFGYIPRFVPRKTAIAIAVEDLNIITLTRYESLLLSSIAFNLTASSLRFEIIPVHEIEHAVEFFVDGMIAILPHGQEESLSKVRGIRGIPVLLINNPAEGVQWVCSNHSGGAGMAVDYLVERGHRRIGFFQASEKSWGSKERVRGYFAALERHGIEPDMGIVAVQQDLNVYEGIARICRQSPTALIVSGEEDGLRAMHALHLLGRRVPEDMSVISYEDPRTSQYLCPAHTTVSQQLDYLGELAVRRMREILEGKTDGPVQETVPNLLIERESVRAVQQVLQKSD